MIKKAIIFKCFITLMLVASTASAALHWGAAAYIWTGTAIAVTALSFGTATPIVLALGGAVGFHAGVFALYWDDANPPTLSSGATASRGLSVVLDPNTPLVAPSGWTEAAPTEISTNQNLEPHPPSTTDHATPYKITINKLDKSDNSGTLCSGTSISSTQCQYSNDNIDLLVAQFSQDVINSRECTFGGEAANNGAVNEAHCANFQVLLDYENYPDDLMKIMYTFCSGNNGQYCDDETWNNYQVSTATCKAGYALNVDANGYPIHRPSQCTLSNEASVQKPADDVCEVRVKTGKFTKMRNDPDCTNTAMTGMGTTQVIATTPTKAVYLVTSASHDVSVYEKFFDETTNKTTTNIANIGATGTINYLQTVNALGNQVGVNPGTVDASNGNTGGSGTGTEGAATNDKLDEIFADGTYSDISSSESPNIGISPFADFFNPLKSFSVASQGGQCPSADLELFDQTYALDLHCTIFNEHKPVIQNAMTLVYLIAGLFIVLSA